jgi:hypothetical protein
MTVAESKEPFEWEVSWTNLFDGENIHDVIGQAVGEMQEAVNNNTGSTVLVIRNRRTKDKFVYDLQEGIVLKHYLTETEETD